jgi:GT2 family glycosyltransferase/glycosyltransferase involved in cell wall biosynthesis
MLQASGMPLPAHILLDPGCAIRPAWAVFDRTWYLRTYPDARAICQNKPPEAALLYYLRVGARLGHGPSALFDEAWYLARNPDIAELVRAGNYASGFDHYCQHGYRSVSPHWLFDDALYADLYEDMTLENLDQHQCFGRYDHYLKSGQRERRMGQFLFDGAFYRDQAIAAGVPAEEIDAPGPYVHFLTRLGAGREELPPSIYFDPFWYVEHHPAAKAEIARGRYSAAIHHYLCSGNPEQLDPVPQFSEAFYRRRHPDIAAAIEHGLYRSGYQQFVQYGAFELRQPSAGIDLMYYRDMHERVRNDLNAGTVRDAFAHLRLIGVAEQLACCPPVQIPALDEAETRALFLKKSRAQLPIFTRRKLDFTHDGPPTLAVIMVLFNRFELTMLALSSLRDHFSGAIELVLVDNDSRDATRRIGEFVLGAKILRNKANIGFLRGCNMALAHVTAPAVLLLNNDTELAHGAVTGALARLESAENIGAVGGKIIRTNGLLQEAGSIIWNDGTTSGYLRDAAPNVAEANFMRDVDYCSAVFLLCRTALVQRLGGFDDAYAPAYFEDADLCVRMIRAGYRIVYDPTVAIHHLEFGSAASTEASMALMRRGKRIFKSRQAEFLQTRPAPSSKTSVQARSRSVRRSVLFVEDTVPLRRLGSGFVRANDIVHAIVQAGYEVHVYPINGMAQEMTGLLGDLPDGVEILYDRDFQALPEFLAERRGVYDLIWVSRTHNFKRLRPLLEQAAIDIARLPLVLDSEALATVRDAARARLLGQAFDFEAQLRKEFAGTETCRRILAVNAREAELLTAIGLRGVAQLGTARHPGPTPASFAGREGILYVGAMHQADSPNLDALEWYVSNILPALAAEMGTPPMLHVVGYTAPEIDLRAFADHPHLTLHGEINDLTPFYNSTRLFIAPTRFAAGTPYKIYETAAFGLPCVASEILVQQLGWTAAHEILSVPTNDATTFARQIALLYGSQDLWQKLRANALMRLEQENDVERFQANIEAILKSALAG